MTATREQLTAVLTAATLVLERRADQMLTAQEWDALQRAVDACGSEAQAPRDLHHPHDDPDLS